MGTPEFAAASLGKILEQGFEIAGVVTAPDKPSGRGRKLSEPPVKKLALRHDLKVLQPVNLKSPEFVEQFRALGANVGVVVAFRMLPEVIWSMPEYGTFNLHASLLPDYRGAAPIHHAVMNGEQETGVTTFFLKHEIDTGDVIFRERVPIAQNETTGDVHDKLMVIGADLVIRTLHAIESGAISLKKQSDFADESTNLHPAPKIYKDDCRIEWDKPVEEIHNKIRGLSPVPGAFTLLKSPDGEVYQLKIYKSFFEHTGKSVEPRRIETDERDTLFIYGKDGKIKIVELQLQGRKRMDIQSFLNGVSISKDWNVI